jgi:hypothetical protein
MPRLWDHHGRQWSVARLLLSQDKAYLIQAEGALAFAVQRVF